MKMFSRFLQQKKQPPVLDMSADISFDISLVTYEGDWKVLAPILIKCDDKNLLAQPYYLDPKLKLESAETRKWVAFKDPCQRLCKATVKGTNTVVGFSTIIFRNDTISDDSGEEVEEVDEEDDENDESDESDEPHKNAEIMEEEGYDRDNENLHGTITRLSKIETPLCRLSKQAMASYQKHLRGRKHVGELDTGATPAPEVI
jgi:hypothetical protein